MPKLMLQILLLVSVAFRGGLANNFPAESYLSESIMEAFRDELTSGQYLPAYLLVTPPQCGASEICVLFANFWLGITNNYPGRTLVKQCKAGVQENPFCNDQVSNPFFVEWTQQGWAPYSGSTSFHALHELIREQLAGIVSPDQQWLKKYSVSNDLFTQGIPVMRDTLAALSGEPCKILEIGSFEGVSTCWLVDEVLSHPQATITTVDPFTDLGLQSSWLTSTTGAKQRSFFLANVALSDHPQKVTSFVGTSKEYFYGTDVLKTELETFDMVFIDGGQTAEDVLLDAVSSWSLLKPGGILIFDSYVESSTRGVQEAGNPRMAIDAFVACHKAASEVLHAEASFVLRKRLPGEEVEKEGDDDGWGVEGLDELDFDGVADLFRSAASEVRSDGGTVDDGWGIEGMDDMASLFEDDEEEDDDDGWGIEGEDDMASLFEDDEEEDDDDGGWGTEGVDDMYSLFQEGAQEVKAGRHKGL